MTLSNTQMFLLSYSLVLFAACAVTWRDGSRWLAYVVIAPFTLVAYAAGLILSILVSYAVDPLTRHAFSTDTLRILCSLPILPASGIALVWFLNRKGVPRSDQHLRGTQLLDGAAYQKQTRKAQLARGHELLTLAGVGVPPGDEDKHFKLIGTTGTGKSTAIAELLHNALERGDRAIFADPDGGYRQRFYRKERGDLILNPFDPSSVGWNLFAEIQAPYEIDHLAHSMIPEGEGTAREWRGYARVFLAEVMRHCHREKTHDLARLWHLLAIATVEELRPVLAGTPAQPYLDSEGGRMFSSLRSVCTSQVAALQYLVEGKPVELSIRDWIQNGQGVLFLPYRAKEISALKGLIATWVRLGVFETLSRPLASPDQAEPLWFVVDELDALGAIDGLEDALARLRKFNGRCVLGFQSIAQVSATYGDKSAQTIVENCGNTLILRCSSSERGGTAEFASRLIGEREVIRTEHSSSVSRTGMALERTRSKSESTRSVKEAAVLPSEIEQLPNLSGYLKCASDSGWMRVSWQHAGQR